MMCHYNTFDGSYGSNAYSMSFGNVNGVRNLVHPLKFLSKNWVFNVQVMTRYFSGTD